MVAHRRVCEPRVAVDPRAHPRTAALLSRVENNTEGLGLSGQKKGRNEGVKLEMHGE